MGRRVDDRHETARQLFVCGYAALLDEPPESSVVQELALAAVDSAAAARHVVLHGHGLASGVFKAGRYRHSQITLDGPPMRRE
jgi:hypothetical protein